MIGHDTQWKIQAMIFRTKVNLESQDLSYTTWNHKKNP